MLQPEKTGKTKTKRMQKPSALFLTLCLALCLTGCVRGTHIVTGKQRPSVPTEAVQLYPTAPDHYEIIGVVNARARGSGQTQTDRATRELKHQASLIGANGIILNPIEHNGLAGRKLNLSGQAIYVLP